MKMILNKFNITYIFNITLIIITFWISVIDEIINNNEISSLDYLSGEKIYLFLLNISLLIEMYLVDYKDQNLFKTEAILNFIYINIFLYIGSFIKFQNIFGSNILKVWNLILFLILVIKTIYHLTNYFKNLKNEKENENENENYFVKKDIAEEITI